MKIVYLPSTKDDLIWMRHYYEKVFPEGRKHAQKQFHSIEALLQVSPLIGHASYSGDALEFSIPKTPFSYIYRVKNDEIQVLRVWDERQNTDNLEF